MFSRYGRVRDGVVMMLGFGTNGGAAGGGLPPVINWFTPVMSWIRLIRASRS
jgi:hypothetical protein